MAQRRLSRQPKQAQIDWTNPLTRGLVVAYSGGREYVKNRVVRINTGTPPAVDAKGFVSDTLTYSGGGGSVWVDFGDAIGATGPMSYVTWLIDDGSTGAQASGVSYGDRATIKIDTLRFYTYNGSSWNDCDIGGGTYMGAGLYKLAAIHDGALNQGMGFWPGGGGYNSAACTARGGAAGQTLRLGADSENGRSFGGTVPVLLAFNRALSVNEANALIANPWQVFKRPARVMALASSANVTVALTGVSATGAAGALGPSNVVALPGVAGTGQVGSLTAANAPPLVGNAATGAVGSLSVGNATPLAGVAGTGAVGVLAPSNTVGVTGNAGAGAVGSLKSGISAALPGLNAVGSVGAFSPGTSIVMLGNQGTGQVGALTATAGSDVTVALTGVQALGQVGVLVSDIARILTGNSATGQIGTLTPNAVRTLSGNQVTGSVGTLTPTGGTPAASMYVHHADDMGVVERYADNGDGTFSLVLTTVNGAGKSVRSRHFGLQEQFVLQGDGSHARLVATATLGGSDVLVRHPIDGGITLRYVDMGGGLFAEKVATSGATGQDKTVRIWEDTGVAQRYVSQGDGTWARLVATSGAGGAVVRNRWDGYIFERWTPNGDGTNSQRVQLL